MPDKKTLKRYFIIAVIASLVASAGMGIFALLFGSFGVVEWKILGSTLAIGVFSITSLANLRNIESEHFSYRAFAWLSILFSICGMVLIMLLIWANFEGEFWRLALTLFILAISTAHASLLLPSRSNEPSWLVITTAFTLFFITMVAGFLIYLIFSSSAGANEFIYRIIGMFAILDVLGTIVVPVLGRLGRKDAPVPPSEPLSPPVNNNQNLPE